MAKSTTARVVIPRNPDEFLTLAKLVFAKHTADGATSKLNGLSDYNWTDNGAKIDEAITLQARAKQMEKDLEELYRLRDIQIAPVDKTVKASRDLLLGAFASNPKKLGEWGFTVNDTAKAKPKNP